MPKRGEYDTDTCIAMRPSWGITFVGYCDSLTGGDTGYYLQPNGLDKYLQPNGTDYYLQPGGAG